MAESAGVIARHLIGRQGNGLRSEDSLRIGQTNGKAKVGQKAQLRVTDPRANLTQKVAKRKALVAPRAM